MSYLVQSRLAADQAIMQRVTACAALEGVEDPSFWVSQRAWKLSAQPGWVEKYAAGGASPGANESAITDAMILAAVQTLREPSE